VEHLPGVRAGELNVTVAVPVEQRAGVIGGVKAITTSTARWQLSPRPPHLARAGYSGPGDEFSRPGRY